MYNFLALLSGVFIALMVAVNGDLTAMYGNYNATFIVHVVAVILAFAFSKLGKKKLFPTKKLPLWFYAAGAFGIFSVFFSNYAFSKISLTSILALNLFGQTVFSLLIDNLGLFGMEKHPFKKSSLIGLIFSLAGVTVMLVGGGGVDLTEFLAILLSFATGLNTVFTRSINARLSEHVGAMPGSFINHLVGLPITLLLVLLMPGNDISLLVQRPSPHLWIYLGGLCGLLIVFLMNITVPKLPAFRLTLLAFVGQVFVGIVIDLIIKHDYSSVNFYGGLIVAVGVCLNILNEYVQNSRQKKAVEE